MDTITLITFLTGGSLVASLITGLLKKGLSSVSDRYGSLATQVVLFIVSLIVATGLTASTLLPQNWLLIAGGVFAGAITIYEVLYKAVWQQMVKGQI